MNLFLYLHVCVSLTGKHQHGDLAQLNQFRNNELVPDQESLGGGSHVNTARRMSITNAMDILRDRLLRAIKRKQVNVSSSNICDVFINIS